MNNLCVICARKGSKGIKNKNTKSLYGIPLIGYTIRQAVKSKVFSKIVVSSDSDEIRKISKKFGAESWFKRPKYLSTDRTGKIPVIIHALKESERYYKTKFDTVFDLGSLNKFTNRLGFWTSSNNPFSLF